MNFFVLKYEEIEKMFLEKKIPKYVLKNVLHWIFNKKIFNPLEFSNVGKETRHWLCETFDWTLPSIGQSLSSEDGCTKYALKLYDGKWVEMVLMPYEERVSLCVSSQIGCKMGCVFCQTGQMGFLRNLGFGEILFQLLLAQETIEKRISHVVFMGMGEPLDNFDNVVQATKLMLSDSFWNLSKQHLTISTCGLPSQILNLAKQVDVRLAVSLHSAINEIRSSMMPVNKSFPLEKLKEALLEYPQGRHGITFEYAMVDGVNDSLEDAKALIRFLHHIKCKVNLIPINQNSSDFKKATKNDNILKFQNYLNDRGIQTTIRISRGQDIQAACGQLATSMNQE